MSHNREYPWIEVSLLKILESRIVLELGNHISLSFYRFHPLKILRISAILFLNNYTTIDIAENILLLLPSGRPCPCGNNRLGLGLMSWKEYVVSGKMLQEGNPWTLSPSFVSWHRQEEVVFCAADRQKLSQLKKRQLCAWIIMIYFPVLFLSPWHSPTFEAREISLPIFWLLLFGITRCILFWGFAICSISRVTLLVDFLTRIRLCTL